MRTSFIGACALILAAGSAAAQPLPEVESNNSFATANLTSPAQYPTGAVAYTGLIAPDGTVAGIDFFAFDLLAGDFVTASVFDNTPDVPDDNDGLLGIFGPGGTFFDGDDDDGPGLLPSYSFFVPTSGRWAFAVTGFGDDDFDGTHEEGFAYTAVFSITPVPAPGAAAVLALGGACALRRRR